jgi:hypothetical protein
MLALVCACGDSGTGGAGGTSSSSSVASTSSSGTTASSSSASTTSSTTDASSSSSGTGGEGGMSDVPVLEKTKIGDPLWEPVDYHQFAAPVGDMFMDFESTLEGLLPAPNHEPHPDLGIGPGMAHAGPYDGEIAAGVLAHSYVDKTTYTQAEGSLPNAIISAWMLVPSTGALTGASPDGASTPIIPNEIFPINASFDAFESGTLLDGYSYSFDVPALDDQLNPPFTGMDGHSHIPLFNAVVFDGLPTIPGTLETHINLIDAQGNGWHLVLTANATN